MKFFGRPKAQTSSQDTISKLRLTLEMLDKRQKFLQDKADREELEAKKLVTQKRKREALLCLKKRNNFQNEVNKLQGSYDTLSSQIFALENAKMNMEIMNSMKEGAQTLKDLHGHLTVDKVDDTIEEIQTQMEIHEEISRAISQPLGTQLDDEDDLLRELAELEQEDLDAQLLQVTAPSRETPVVNNAATIKFPTASTVKPEISKEEEEYRALQESLAM
ncbi:hypothetical protein CYY_000036 [Polysphondylium violaceum]|uniref:SNF7 family protein n=1 Tax=Polysphondylium violaceum TaxID=133409 RepID=A0A8J4Q3K5_9MYCE|nr:hypothetical protein CYY_000036 [Polysphondylium violaceum]